MPDCIIIGGGVKGLRTALELADAGDGVQVGDRGERGHGASWAGGGLLRPSLPCEEPGAVMRLELVG